jgi:hypothetical protein
MQKKAGPGPTSLLSALWLLRQGVTMRGSTGFTVHQRQAPKTKLSVCRVMIAGSIAEAVTLCKTPDG